MLFLDTNAKEISVREYPVFSEKNYYIHGRVIARFSAFCQKNVPKNYHTLFADIANEYREFCEKEIIPGYIKEYEDSNMKRKRRDYKILEISLDADISEDKKGRAIIFKISENDMIKSFSVRLFDDNTLVYSKIKL